MVLMETCTLSTCQRYHSNKKLQCWTRTTDSQSTVNSLNLLNFYQQGIQVSNPLLAAKSQFNAKSICIDKVWCYNC